MDPSNIFKNCNINVSFFTTDRFEASLNVGGSVNCESITWIKDFQMAGHQLVMMLRSWGYLIDWNSVGCRNLKRLFKEVEECFDEPGTAKPFTPDILEDVSTPIDLTGGSGSRPST